MSKVTSLLGLTFVFILSLIFSIFFFKDHHIGPDFSYYLPIMQLNKQYFLNKSIIAPLFSPGFCGGFISYANPQDLYYSIKQLIFNFTPTSISYHLIFGIYSVIGFIGAYFLLNRSFNLNSYTSILGTILFCFNGFFLVRFFYGHLGFIDFNLLPLFIFFIIQSTKFETKKNISYLLIGSLLIMSLIYSGSASILPYFLSSTFLIIFLYYDFFKLNLKIFLNLFISIGIGILLGSSKIYLFLKVLINNPRELVTGSFDNIYGLILFFFNALFGFGSDFKISNSITSKFRIEAHELNYNISVIALLLIIVSLSNTHFVKKLLKTFLFYSAVLIFLTLTMINENFASFFYVNKFTVVPMRFLSILILPLILIAILGSITTIEKISHTIKINFNFILILLYLPLQILIIHKTIFFNFPLIEKYQNYELTPIKSVALFVNKNNDRLEYPLTRNDLIFSDISTLNCYEPLHGYLNEKMDISKFTINEVKEFPDLNVMLINPYEGLEDNLNFYKPSCFLFPEENNCKPYDHFKVSEKDDLEQFMNFNQFQYTLPSYYKILNYVCLFFLIFTISLIFYFRKK